MILQNRTAWNVQRLFWYLWRDPALRRDASYVQLLRHARGS